MRPKGFGYVEFVTLDGLKKALTLDGESFQGRMIKIKVADPRMSSCPTLSDYYMLTIYSSRRRSRSWRFHS